jgi:hypothetical protein
MLLVGLLRPRAPPIPRVATLAEAFQLLEYWLRRAYPDLPEGFTWREALERAPKSDKRIDWQRLLSIIERYEAYRYGGSRLEDTDPGEVLRWAAVLARGARGARRPQA